MMDIVPANGVVPGRIIWLHFLDHEVLRLYRIPPSHQRMRVRRYVDALVRAALLVCEEFVLLPAAAAFETPYADAVLEDFAPFTERQRLRPTGGALTSEDFREKKAQQGGD
jgi:hypothetical protein